MSTISKSTTIAVATIAVAAATGATRVNAAAIASDAKTPTSTATNASDSSAPQSAYAQAQASEASKLSNLKDSQAASEAQTAKDNATAESNAASSNATAESNAATAQSEADAKAQSDANAAYNAQKDANSATASSYAASQASDLNSETKAQASDAANFAAQQAKDTGSAQSQRDAVTSEYNDSVASQKASAADKDTSIDQTAKAAATSAAQTAQSQADTQANSQQTAQTSAANADASAKSDAQTTTYNNQVANQTSQNQASETSAQKAVDDAQYNIDHPTATPATPVDSTTNPNDAYDDGHTINRTGNLPTSVVNPKIPSSAVNDEYYADYYGATGDKDTTEAINGSATASQQKELADYAITLINSVRAQNGLAPITWSKNVEDATIASAQAREKAGAGFTHTEYLTSSAKADTEAAYTAKGLTFSLENMGMTSTSELTMLTAKAAILNAITAMVYQDGFSQNGHLENFLTTDLTMGFAIQQFNGGYILLFQGAYPDSTYDASDANNANQALTSTAMIEADRGGDTDANRAVLTTAKANLTSVQTANAQKLTDLANANTTAQAAIQTELQNTIASINATHDAAIQADATTYAQTVANIQATATKQHQENATQLANTLASMQSDYEATIAGIKDLTPDQLAAKKATELQAFQEKQASALQAFKDGQAKDAEAFQARLDASLATLKSQLDADVANEVSNGKAKLAQLKSDDQKAYDALVASNATRLANLKQANANAYAKAKTDSQKYLDSINPANQKPANPGKGSQSGNNSGNGTNSSSHVQPGKSGTTTTTNNGKSSNASHMIYDPSTSILAPIYTANAEDSASTSRLTGTPKRAVTVDASNIDSATASVTTKRPMEPETGVSQKTSPVALIATAVIATAGLSTAWFRRKNTK